MLTREEWLERYRAYMLSRCPGLDDETLAELTSHEVYDDLVGDYPENPEQAIDNELEGRENPYLSFYPLKDEEFHRRLRADAVSNLATVKALLRIAPPALLERLDERAAGYERLIREYDAYLAGIVPL